jgi:hypothetical protein
MRRAEGGANILGVFRVKNHDFTPKIIFFPIAEGGAKIVEVFLVKNPDFTPKNLIFSNFRGGGGGGFSSDKACRKVTIRLKNASKINDISIFFSISIDAYKM